MKNHRCLFSCICTRAEKRVPPGITYTDEIKLWYEREKKKKTRKKSRIEQVDSSQTNKRGSQIWIILINMYKVTSLFSVFCYCFSFFHTFDGDDFISCWSQRSISCYWWSTSNIKQSDKMRIHKEKKLSLWFNYKYSNTTNGMWIFLTSNFLYWSKVIQHVQVISHLHMG